MSSEGKMAGQISWGTLKSSNLYHTIKGTYGNKVTSIRTHKTGIQALIN